MSVQDKLVAKSDILPPLTPGRASRAEREAVNCAGWTLIAWADGDWCVKHDELGLTVYGVAKTVADAKSISALVFEQLRKIESRLATGK